jgi:hypothetical protein
LAIGDADPAIVVEGQGQTLVNSTVQNKKRFIKLESFENRRGDPLEGFGEDFTAFTCFVPLLENAFLSCQ